MSYMPPPSSEETYSSGSTRSPLAPRPVSFFEAVSLYYSNYANFSGRASRSEYWFVALYSFIFGIGFSVLALSTGTIDPYTGAPQGNGLVSAIYWIWILVNFIPSLSVLWRRLHDVNKSGGYAFMVLIPFIGWIFVLIALVKEGDLHENRFGPAS